MNWITKLERKYGRFCIPNLINILIGGQILVYAIELFVNQYISFYLSLSRSALFAGQIWRLFTFVLVPFSGGGPLSVVLGIILIANPFGAMETLVMAIGVILIVEGAINLLSALYTVLAVRRFAKLHPETQSVLESITGEDLNGDGKTVVTLNVYTLDYSAGDTQTESDAYLTMAGTTKLATDVAGGLSSVFLLYDPAGFQESTGSLRYLDGTLPEAGSDSDWWNMVYRWTDCPVLTGMELGSYTSDAVQSASGDSQQLLADYYIGIRGAWLKESASLLENSEPLWASLTAGAVSTAGEGH